MFLNGSPHAVHDLWDVAAHHANLKLTCKRCGHWRIFHAAAVWWLFCNKGWHGNLRAAAERFYCGVCWEVDRVKIRTSIELVNSEASGDELPLPPEREWKREARRRR